MDGVAATLESVGNIARRLFRREGRGPEHGGSVGSRVVSSVQVVACGFREIGADQRKAQVW